MIFLILVLCHLNCVCTAKASWRDFHWRSKVNQTLHKGGLHTFHEGIHNLFLILASFYDMHSKTTITFASPVRTQSVLHISVHCLLIRDEEIVETCHLGQSSWYLFEKAEMFD